MRSKTAMLDQQRHLAALHWISISVFAVIGLSLFLTGCVYLLRDEFMPYHAEAIQTEWGALGPNLQALLLGLIKGLGSGAFVSGLVILVMVGVSLKGIPRSFVLLLPITAIGYSGLLCYATYTVYSNTPGNPPLGLTVALVVASIIASLALTFSRR